ncbi:MAG: hypothetical protein COA79_04510 [Planctomycetota bacterium]|nr:MAG: hypothetical protein COA79_04510 [Planctomycetota bacterium]
MLYDKYHLFIGRDALFNLLFKNSLLVKRKPPGFRTTHSAHHFEKHPNRIKSLNINKAEQVFVSDITYIRVAKKFMYLFLVTDIYSKRIMGYNLGDTLHRKHGLKALQKAISNRQKNNQDIFHHSDCGAQYCSKDYTQLLRKNGFQISMTEEDHCYENSVAERVNGILKGELGLGEVMSKEDVARQRIAKAINIYNNKRLHLSCGLLTPNQAHIQGKGLKKMWKKRVYKKKSLELLAVSSRPTGSLQQPVVLI